MYKLKVKKGSKTVEGKLRAGKDIVNATIGVGSARSMIARSEQYESDIDGYPICIEYEGYKWYFPGTKVEEKEETKENESNE